MFQQEILNAELRKRYCLAFKLNDFFTLFEFSAKWDPVPTMLCQNHTRIIKGFIGQTTSFSKELIKPNVIIMGENKSLNEARYIHGKFGKGTWTFYGGHDPEDYRHKIGDPKTELELSPNSPGYRLILNNILMNSNLKIYSKKLFIILMICFPISFVVGNLAINLITFFIIVLGLFNFEYKKKISRI